MVTIKHVTLPQKGQALGQATALGDAGNLLGEHLLNARGFEFAFLRGEASGLIKRAGASVSDDHFAPPAVKRGHQVLDSIHSWLKS
ncbi:MAG TPA: hypothetical protein VGO18_08240, partial [Steroidobacteraceae bacterium]|nr:hypothetical protein [Steroidobacteraceae bacterium]